MFRAQALEPRLLDPFHRPRHPEILIPSNVRKKGQPVELADGGTYWHADYSCLEVPARAPPLYSVQVPQVGGDTLLAGQERAYEDLPASMKTKIDGMVTPNVYRNRDDPDPQSRSTAPPVTEGQTRKRGAFLIRHPLLRITAREAQVPPA